MRWGFAVLAVVALVVIGADTVQASVAIDGVRSSEENGRTRVVFDVDQAPKHHIFTLGNPDRVVVDFDSAELKTDVLPVAGLLREIRTGRRGEAGLRVVFDVETAVQTRSFVIGSDGDGHRLVVDLTPRNGVTAQRAQPVRSVGERSSREVLVAIDAGHGGVDPGAVGPSGSYEKDVVLSVARRLERLIEQAPRLKPVMIRDGDYYMALRDRTRKAHQHNADLFISLHADGNDNSTVKGASVYALSLRGATSERARMLARRENAADFLGGVSLDDKDDVVASTLVDLMRGATIESSLLMGGLMLANLDRHADLLRNRVDQAGFAVLKSLNMPSLLVELGFMTNPQEERRLNNSRYQQALAEGVFAAVREYAERHVLPELHQAQLREEHRVRQGESLSVIARHYRISTEALREANNIRGDRIVAGDTLVIPH